MDSLVIQAYNKARSKEFFEITDILEKMLRKRYAADDPRFAVTTGQVRRVLTLNKLNYYVRN